jgi:4-diphosphocytidyl-2-C-methyl-D-erythritol kinase
LVSNSYAKINLGLRVLARRPDGYHDIRTGFVFINWYDRLQVEPAAETVFRCNKPDVPADGSNLVLRALDLLRKETGRKLNYRIQLSKNIPMGAGLGGGSSNAAAMLRMVNEMAGLGYSRDQLAALGVRLGADVPVFVMGQPAIGGGTGGDLEFVDIQPDAHIVTVFPNVFSSTAEAYAHCMPYEDEALDVRSVLLDLPMDDWPTFLVNDLEPPVMAMLPVVGDLKDQMMELGATYAAMSGSGSSVFGLFEQEFAAAEAFEYLKQEGYPASLTSPGFRIFAGH